MIEVLIAIFLTTTGILALLALQGPGWKNMAKSDYAGRAAGILYKTMETRESLILNPCNSITTGSSGNITVYPSGQSSAINGDVAYTVTRNTVTDASNTNVYVVTVTVTWPINSTGITESMVVGRQEYFRYPSTCADNSVTIAP